MLEVNFIAAEVHQLRVYDRKPGLARGLCDDARDQVACQHGQHVVLLTNQLQHGHILLIADLCDDVIRFGAAIGIIGDRQHGFDDIGVRIVIFGWQDNNRFGCVRTGDLKIVRVDRASTAANDAGPALDFDPLPDLVLHLHLVLICQQPLTR
jgi:hypothetical protein